MHYFDNQILVIYADANGFHYIMPLAKSTHNRREQPFQAVWNQNYYNQFYEHISKAKKGKLVKLYVWVTYRKETESMLELSFTMTPISCPLHPFPRLSMILHQAFTKGVAQWSIIHSTHIASFCSFQIPSCLLQTEAISRKIQINKLKVQKNIFQPHWVLENPVSPLALTKE